MKERSNRITSDEAGAARRGAAVGREGATAFLRDRATWYAYLMLGFFGFLLNLQGNIVPLLKSELGLSSATVAPHASALAAGLMTTGLTGAPLLARLGPRRAMWFGAFGSMLGTALLCAARQPLLSISACALIGALGGLFPIVVASTLADKHGARRDIAYGEANAAAYAFSLLGPFGIGAAIALGIDWRFAVMSGVTLGVIVVVRFRRVRLAASVPVSAAGAFMVAMIAGRFVASRLLLRHAAAHLLRAALLLALAGFAVYWTLGDAERVGAGWAAFCAKTGLFLTGMGIAPMYPLTLALAVRAAGPFATLASARTTLASGGAILVMPALLGIAADEMGLRRAMLIVPLLAMLALASAAAANQLSRHRSTARRA